MSRETAIVAFLAAHGFGEARPEPLAQDASFRRYLRLCHGPRPAVLMDAPPPEDVRPFLCIAAHLHGIGLSVSGNAEKGADILRRWRIHQDRGTGSDRKSTRLN